MLKTIKNASANFTPTLEPIFWDLAVIASIDLGWGKGWISCLYFLIAVIFFWNVFSIFTNKLGENTSEPVPNSVEDWIS